MSSSAERKVCPKRDHRIVAPKSYTIYIERDRMDQCPRCNTLNNLVVGVDRRHAVVGGGLEQGARELILALCKLVAQGFVRRNCRHVLPTAFCLGSEPKCHPRFVMLCIFGCTSDRCIELLREPAAVCPWLHRDLLQELIV